MTIKGSANTGVFSSMPASRADGRADSHTSPSMRRRSTARTSTRRSPASIIATSRMFFTRASIASPETLDDSQLLALFIGQAAGIVREQQRAESDDGIQRRPKLVTRRAQKRGLGAISSLGAVERDNQGTRALLDPALELGVELIEPDLRLHDLQMRLRAVLVELQHRTVQPFHVRDFVLGHEPDPLRITPDPRMQGAGDGVDIRDRQQAVVDLAEIGRAMPSLGHGSPAESGFERLWCQSRWARRSA